VIRYDKRDSDPPDPFKDNEDLYRDEKKDNGDWDKREYVVKKTWRFNWDDAVAKIFKKIFRR